MTSKLLFTLTLLSALGCGLIGGVFFAFSTFVMKALAALSPPQGIAAMKSINIAAINPMFLGLFLGTGASCIILVISSALTWHKPGSGISARWQCPLSHRNGAGDDDLQRPAQ